MSLPLSGGDIKNVVSKFENVAKTNHFPRVFEKH
jgi:hypothetical protein